MKLHDVIRTRRQTLGLTQEELARRLGVSAPAVNKWERSIHYPDITLLPSLARVLGVDLNTLLSFQEDRTEEDIGLFLNRIYETAGAEGVAAAFALARDKLREFPNSDLLAYHAAEMLMGVLELQPEDDSPERRAQEAEVTALYERCIRSADCQIREWAAFTLASRCIKTGELDRAEELLGQLSDTHRGKRELTARLRRKQGLHKESWILLEQELFDQAHTLQSTLLSMLDYALAEKDPQRARLLADTAVQAGEIFDLSDYAVLSAPFQLAAAEQDGPLTPEELAACEAIRAGLSGNFCRRCGYCAPCTVGIDIPGIFTLENYLKHYDLADWARSRYESQTARAGDCIGCGKCEERCPYELPIREKLKGVAKAFGA